MCGHTGVFVRTRVVVPIVLDLAGNCVNPGNQWRRGPLIIFFHYSTAVDNGRLGASMVDGPNPSSTRNHAHKIVRSPTRNRSKNAGTISAKNEGSSTWSVKAPVPGGKTALGVKKHIFDPQRIFQSPIKSKQFIGAIFTYGLWHRVPTVVLIDIRRGLNAAIVCILARSDLLQPPRTMRS